LKLSRLDIENFQSHRLTSIELDPGVNVITGTSDSGKSSIIRALRWVLTNRPTGMGFLSWQAGGDEPVKTKISFADGSTISRIKSSKENSYAVNGKLLDTIGTDLPEEVREALSMSVDNIQSQQDRYFLLQESPKEVARKLNELVGIDLIDYVMKAIGQMARECGNSLTWTEDSLYNLKDERKSLPDLLAIGEMLRAADDDEKDLDFIRKRSARLSSMASELSSVLDRLIELDWVDQASEYASELGNVRLEYNDTSVSRNKMQHIIFHTRACLKEIEDLEHEIAAANDNLSKLLMSIGLCPICGEKISHSNLPRVMEKINETFADGRLAHHKQNSSY
jgi:DNA repair protein SbcC/Rad50